MLILPVALSRNVGPLSEQDFQTIGTSKSRGASSLPREPSSGKACILRVLFCEEATHVIDKIVSMEDVEPTEVSSKEDVQISNVGTFSESKGKSKEIASSLKEAIHTIDKLVST